MKYTMFRRYRVLLLGGLLLACSKPNHEPLKTYSTYGTAWNVAYFLYPPMKGAEISILEYPGKKCTADSAGHFRIDGLKPGTEVTFKVKLADFYPYYSETYTVDTSDLGPIAFQCPNMLFFFGFAALAETVPEPGKGHVCATVSTADPATFTDLSFPGEPGCTVSIEPALPAECGPIYFDENTYPRRNLTETTKDGGILYINVPPGTYTIYGHKAGIDFRPIKVKIFPNSVTNGTPPFGIRKIR